MILKAPVTILNLINYVGGRRNWTGEGDFIGWQVLRETLEFLIGILFWVLKAHQLYATFNSNLELFNRLLLENSSEGIRARVCQWRTRRPCQLWRSGWASERASNRFIIKFLLTRKTFIKLLRRFHEHEDQARCRRHLDVRK